MGKWIIASVFLLAAVSPAWSSPLLRWDSNDKGFWIIADNPEDRSYNCSTRYTLTIAGQSETRNDSFTVEPRFIGRIAFVRSVILPPNTPWTVVQEDPPSCY
uniref:hypothetical protein n=1 Tax=Phyllobacterium sp. YR531 TaxID=1144343 RepID=UPI00026F8769|nr:hypothetical protein [Phyllobacterium sp. YR531]EJN01363.1 hypothetical protein PMI41_03445 [Phyllobacterium sp. YR531]